MSRQHNPLRRPRSTLRHAIIAVGAIVLLSAVAASTQAYATADDAGDAQAAAAVVSQPSDGE